MTQVKKERMTTPTVQQLPAEALEQKHYLNPELAGQNAALMAFTLKAFEISKSVNRDDFGSLERALDAYLQLCVQTGAKVTNASMYTALGLDRKVVSEWYTGRKRGDDPRYKEFAKTLKRLCNTYREQAMVEGTLDKIVGIYQSKAYDGLSDDPRPEYEVSVPEAAADPQDLAEKYKHLLDTTAADRMEAERAKRSVADVPEDEGDID